MEAFNVFNYAQFYGATAVDGTLGDPLFGYAINAEAPRLMQPALKFQGTDRTCAQLSSARTESVAPITLDNPYPTGQGGASVPGFNALNLGRGQFGTFGHTKTFGPTMVNDLRLSYMRSANMVRQPLGAVQRNIDGPTFGQVIKAALPRLMQAALSSRSDTGRT